MKLIDIIKTEAGPRSFSGMKIPWDDPDFSRRMLANHLSQEHDWASRCEALIKRQSARITSFLPERANILDLGCGPGLYLAQLAAMGHVCAGVDFSPASIEYARAKAAESGLNIGYELADVREYAPVPGGFDAVLVLFGEINVFSRPDAALILHKAYLALKPGGLLFLEAHNFDEVRRQGLAPRSWGSFESGLFSEKPHLCLTESFWDGSSAATRYIIVDAETAECREYASSMSAYTDEDYRELIRGAAFSGPEAPGEELWPVGEEFDGKLELMICRK